MRAQHIYSPIGNSSYSFVSSSQSLPFVSYICISQCTCIHLIYKYIYISALSPVGITLLLYTLLLYTLQPCVHRLKTCNIYSPIGFPVTHFIVQAICTLRWYRKLYMYTFNINICIYVCLISILQTTTAHEEI